LASSNTGTDRYYRPELDVLRFLAFLIVFLCHDLPHQGDPDPRLNHLLGGFVPMLYAFQGACNFSLGLFFCLSAFLICELLVRERERTGEVLIKQFYIRRILRIWPLYYFVLGLGAIVPFLPFDHGSSHAGLGWFAVFLGAWYCAFFGFIRNPLFPLWSISVEEQFYLIVPWAVKYLNRRSLYGLCATLILLSNVELYFLGKAGVNSDRIWCDSIVQFECFAAGILLSLLLRGRLPSIPLWSRAALTGSGLCCWFVACYGLHAIFSSFGGTNPGSWPLIFGYALGALGSVLMLIAHLGIDARHLPSWAIYFGRISFGLYAYHEFAVYIAHRIRFDLLLFQMVRNYPLRVCLNILATFGVPLALTLVMAIVSYRYIETPFLRMKKRFAVIKSQPIAAA